MLQPKMMTILQIIQYLDKNKDTVISTNKLMDLLFFSKTNAESALSSLRKAGIVSGKRGHNGGYVLDKDISQVTLQELYESVYDKGYKRVLSDGFKQITIDKVIDSFH